MLYDIPSEHAGTHLSTRHRVSPGRALLLIGAALLLVLGPPGVALEHPAAAVTGCPTASAQGSPPASGEHDSWSRTSPTLTERYLLASATGCDGTIYAIGGLEATAPDPTPEDVAITGDVEAYDPGTQTWRLVAPLPTPRVGLAAVTGRDGHIYAIGGSETEQFDASDVVEVYSPDSGDWESGAPLPVAVADATATTDSVGNIYVFDADVTEIYQAASDTWSTAAPMPTVRDRMVVAAGPDGRIYVAGGYDATSGNSGPVDTVEVFTPSTGSWSTAAPLPHPAGQTAGVAAADGRIMVFGGDSDWSTVDTAAYAYSPSTGRWAALADLPTPRATHTAAVGADGRIYLIGGGPASTEQDLGTLSEVDVYTP